MGEDAPKPECVSLLKPIAEASAIFGALAFTAGWACLYSYYNSFGLELFDMDIPLSAGSLFAIRVLCRSAWPTVVLVVATLLISAAHSLLKPDRIVTRTSILHGLVLLTAISLAFSGVQVGHTSAIADMNETTTELPSVAFVSSLKADYPLPTCLISNTLDCRLLTHSKGNYFFFRPSNAKGNPNISVFSVPDGQVQLTRLQRGLQ